MQLRMWSLARATARRGRTSVRRGGPAAALSAAAAPSAPAGGRPPSGPALDSGVQAPGRELNDTKGVSAAEFSALMKRLALPRERVVVGVSGGPDSLALVVLLKQYADATGGALQPVAITVDHALRPESAAEARAVHSMMERLGVEHHVLRLDWAASGPPRLAALQTEARERRRRVLLDACRALHVRCVRSGRRARARPAMRALLPPPMDASSLAGTACWATSARTCSRRS
jgi:hypothetical protein